MTDLEKMRLMAGIIAVQKANCDDMIPDPNGDNPRCKPRLYTRVCYRCNNHLDDTRDKACPASQPEDRWRFK